MVKRPTPTPADKNADGHDDDNGQFVAGNQEARKLEDGEAGEPAVTGDPPGDPPPPAEAEPERAPEPVEASETFMFDLSDDGVMTVTADWARDDADTRDRIELAALTKVPTIEEIAAWDDETVQQVDVWAYSVCLSASDNEGIDIPDRPAVLADLETEPEPLNTEAQNDAPLTPAEAQDVTAAINRILGDEPIPPPLPVPALTATHVSILGDLVSNKYGLYAFPPHGFALQPGGAYYPATIVKQLVDVGLALLEPSGGRDGSVKITPAGAAAYKQARQAALSEA